MKRSLPLNLLRPGTRLMARLTPAARSVVLTNATCATAGAESKTADFSSVGVKSAAPMVAEASLRNRLRFIGAPPFSVATLQTACEFGSGAASLAPDARRSAPHGPRGVLFHWTP